MKKLVVLVIILVVGFIVGFLAGGGDEGELRERIQGEIQENLDSVTRDRNIQKVENQIWRAMDKLRDADLDASANNFGQAKEAIRRVLDRLEEAYKAAAGNEELQAKLDEIRTLLESAREDLTNLRAEGRDKIEQAINDLDRLIGD